MPRLKEKLARAEKVAALVGGMPPAERTALLRLAGYDQPRVLAVLATTLRHLEDELNAQRVERLVVGVGRGVNEVREFVDIDWTARHRAIDTMLSVLGMYPSRNAGVSGDKGDTVINIMVAGKPEPKPVEVIDVTPNPAQ
jgi:hypothetical protein